MPFTLNTYMLVACTYDRMRRTHHCRSWPARYTSDQGTCRSAVFPATGSRTSACGPHSCAWPPHTATCTGTRTAPGTRGSRGSRGTTLCPGDSGGWWASPRRAPDPRLPVPTRGPKGLGAAWSCSRCHDTGSWSVECPRTLAGGRGHPVSPSHYSRLRTRPHRHNTRTSPRLGPPRTPLSQIPTNYTLPLHNHKINTVNTRDI